MTNGKIAHVSTVKTVFGELAIHLPDAIILIKVALDSITD